MRDDVRLIGLFYRGDGPTVGPLAPAEIDRLLADTPPAAEAAPGYAAEPFRVLVVDDDPTGAEKSAELLRRHGAEVGAVCDGGAALQLALTVRPDVALIDVRLSEMTGFEKGLQLLRQSAGGPPLVVAVSGRGDQGRRQHWVEPELSGGCLVLPSRGVLSRLRSIREWLPCRDGRPAAGSELRRRSRSGARPPGPRVQRCGDVTVLTFAAHPTGAVGDRIATQLDCLTEGLGGGHLLLDFWRIDRINSEELGTLIRLQKTMNAAAGRLTLFNLRPSVLEVFTLTHLDRILAICRGHAPESGEAHATSPPQENS
jgi:CheY-like chemotaxis protein/anti-anti-sigma regulatory factor